VTKGPSSSTTRLTTSTRPQRRPQMSCRWNTRRHRRWRVRSNRPLRLPCG